MSYIFVCDSESTYSNIGIFNTKFWHELKQRAGRLPLLAPEIALPLIYILNAQIKRCSAKELGLCKRS